MTARNVVARIIKLEASQRRQNGLLLVWRKPDADLREAMSGANYSPGDKVICVEWFGNKPMPSPKWHFDRQRFDDQTSDHLRDTLEAVAAGAMDGPRDPAFGSPSQDWLELFLHRQGRLA